MAAFDAAIEMGAEYLEFDVQLTADGVPIVFHDLVSSRTLRGIDVHGVVSEMTFEQLRHADAGSWFNEVAASRSPVFERQTIQTLSEVLARYRHLARFAIELKSRDDSKSGIEWKVLRTLADHQLLSSNGRVVVMSLSAISPRAFALARSWYRSRPAVLRPRGCCRDTRTPSSRSSLCRAHRTSLHAGDRGARTCGPCRGNGRVDMGCERH